MRYFIGFIITILLLVLLIILLVSGFGTQRKAIPTRSLPSYASTDSMAQATIAGRITSQQTHNVIIVSVTRDEVVYEQQVGYDGEVVKRQTYPNTQNSYDAFLRALAVAGFNKGNSNKNLQNSQGICPLGQRYNFDLTENSKDVFNFWSTSCGTRTYGGNTGMTLTLFQAQVPNYSTLVQNVQL